MPKQAALVKGQVDPWPSARGGPTLSYQENVTQNTFQCLRVIVLLVFLMAVSVVPATRIDW